MGMVGSWIPWAVLAIGAALALGLILIGFQHVFRGTPYRRFRELDRHGGLPTASDDAFREHVETHVGTELTQGNRVEVLFNGDDIYPRLFADLRAASDLITWHVFWFKPGRLADQVSEILCERARAGVRVLFLHDWYGSRGTPDAYFRCLREAGVEVATFRPPDWKTLYKLQQRSHTRAVVVDGRTGYTGGFAIADEWMGNGREPGAWRDTSVRLQGPSVYQLQAGFVTNWIEATGELLVGDRPFPDNLPRPGSSNAGVLFNTPSIGSTEAERYLALSIWGARRTLYITNAYFIPNPAFRDLLVRAARKGVDVRVLNPGANTDRPATWYAGRRHYETLLSGGVRIFEYRPTMVHAKTLVVDRCWSAVGTINFDNRSLSLNDEVVLLCHGAEVGARLHDRFLEDIELAEEVGLESFQGRGAWERGKEALAGVASPLL